MKTTLSQVCAANPGWFSEGNKVFFQDISYHILYGGKSQSPYLVRSTYRWADMFGGPRRIIWRINRLSKHLLIQSLVDDEFFSLIGVQQWLGNN